MNIAISNFGTPGGAGMNTVTSAGERAADIDEETNYYAGPFCSCGDYSCAAMRDEHAPCSTAEGEHYVGSFYPEHWTDEDIDAYEFEFVIDAARCDNEDAAAIAAAQLGTSPLSPYAAPPRNHADDNRTN